MKKVLSFLLVFAMILSSSAMVFAETGDEYQINYYDYRVDPWSYTDEKEWVLLGPEDLSYPTFTYTEGQESEFLMTYMQGTTEKEFQGWYDAPEGGQLVSEISSDWTGDIDLYAKWYDIPQLVDCSSWEAVEAGQTYRPYITISHEDLGEENVDVRFTWYKDDADYEDRVTNAGIKNSDRTYTSYFSSEALSAEEAIGEYRVYARITKDLGNGEEYCAVMDGVKICYGPEGSVGYVDGVLYQDEETSEGEWALFDAINDGSTVDLLTDISNDYFDFYVFTKDLTINANGHSMKDVVFSRPITVSNPGGSWEFTLANGNFEDDYFMSGGFVKVLNNFNDANFKVSFEQEIENPSGYYFLSGVDASKVSVDLSGYAAYNYGDNVGLIESAALPYAVAVERSGNRITKFDFYASFDEAKWASDDNTVYVVDYYNSASKTLSNVYDCYEVPSGVTLKSLYRTTDGSNTSFYLFNGLWFVEQYNNGKKIDMPRVQEDSYAELNCYLQKRTDLPLNKSGVVVKNSWKEVTSGIILGSTGPNLKEGGAYYFTNRDIVISREGKYTLLAKGGSVTIAPARGVNPSKITVSVAGELSSLTIAEGVRCAVLAMPGYTHQTRIDYIENNGSLGISGRSFLQTNVKRLVNSGVVKAYEDLVIVKEDCTEDFTAIENRQGGKMYLEGLYMRLAGSGEDVKIVGIENEGELQLLNTSIAIFNSSGSYGVGIENVGGNAILGRPDYMYSYNLIGVDRGYGITSCNNFDNEGSLTIYSLICDVEEDYNGESAAIKAEDSSTVTIKGGSKIDDGSSWTQTTVELLANGSNSYGLKFGDNVAWRIEGSRNGVLILGAKAAIKATVKPGYYQYISSGIYLSDSENPFDIHYSGSSSEIDLLPLYNYYFDWNSAADLYDYNGVIVRNAEAELVEYLESPYPQYEAFTLPCTIAFGYYAYMRDYYYGIYARTNSIEIEQPGRIVDLNGYNIFVENFDDYALLQIYDGDLKLINSSDYYFGAIDGGNNVQTLVDVYVWDAGEEPTLVCDNIVMQNAEYDIYSLEGGVVINSGIYYDDIDFGDGVNIIYDGQFDNQSDPVVIGDWSHTSGAQDGFCVVLKGGQYTGIYERVEFEYSDETFVSNSLFAKDANDTTALIPYGYELNAYDWNGNKIRKITAADFVTTIDAVYIDEEFISTDKSITLDFTLGGTAAVCRVEKASTGGGSGSGSGGYSGGSSSGRKKEDKEPKVLTPASVMFKDVPAGSYFEDAVSWAVANDITKGTGDDLFSPYRICTRAEDICFLYRAAKGAGKDGKTTDVDFPDVPSDAYYKGALAWAVANDVSQGTGNGLFSPDRQTTRESFLTMLYRTACIVDPKAKKAGEAALAEAHKSGSSAKFADVPEGSYAEEAIYWAQAAGICKGVGTTEVNGTLVENSFGYGVLIDRAQTVTLLCRYFGK